MGQVLAPRGDAKVDDQRSGCEGLSTGTADGASRVHTRKPRAIGLVGLAGSDRRIAQSRRYVMASAAPGSATNAPVNDKRETTSR